MRKLSTPTGRCAELRLRWPGWQEKLVTARDPWNRIDIVIRVRGISGVSPKGREVLQHPRLHQVSKGPLA